MYLMYVDESGDPGKGNSPTRYFILSAIVFHESCWQEITNDLKRFKRMLKIRYGLRTKEEIHAAVFLNRRIRTQSNILPDDRLEILKRCLDWLNDRNDISIISVRIDKNNSADAFEDAWKLLLQEYDHTLAQKNFPGPFTYDKGIIIADHTNGKKVTKIMRQLRTNNRVLYKTKFGEASRNMPLRAVLEDAGFRESDDSLILQMVDVVAYFARQIYEPNNYLREKEANNYYGRLAAVINTHVRSGNKNYKIIEK